MKLCIYNLLIICGVALEAFNLIFSKRYAKRNSLYEAEEK